MQYANLFTSATQPLVYTDNTLVQHDDIVLRLREYDGRVVSAEVAKVWQPMYFRNESPIGVALVSANAQLDDLPAHTSFVHTEEDNTENTYFKTSVLLDQNQVRNHLSPLFRGSPYVREWLGKKGEIRVRPNQKNTEYPSSIDGDTFRHAVIGMAQTGNPAAIFAIGLWQRNAGKMEKAAQCFRASAEQGHAPSWIEIGLIYAEQSRHKSMQNQRYAAECFRQAAQTGSALGAYRLALCHIHGRGVALDEPLALELLQRAADMGLNHAILDLAIYYRFGHFYHHRGEILPRKLVNVGEPNYKKAFELFEYLIQQNWERVDIAKYYVAECYRLALGVRRMDLKKAKQLYHEAAEHGDLKYDEIQNACYYGNHMKRLVKAAHFGYPVANFLLGRAFLKGENGLAADPIRSSGYLHTAASSNHHCAAEAQKLLIHANNTWEFD